MSLLHCTHPLKGDNLSLSVLTENHTVEPDEGESDTVELDFRVLQIVSTIRFYKSYRLTDFTNRID
jgi:hypothetical protein